MLLFSVFRNYIDSNKPHGVKKKFHRLTHICSIRPQWYFCNDTFSYFWMIHFKPWKPIFSVNSKKHVFELLFEWKNTFWTIFNFNLKKTFWKLFFFRSKNEKQPKTVFFEFFTFEYQLQKRVFSIQIWNTAPKTTFLNWMDLFRLFWAAFSI